MESKEVQTNVGTNVQQFTPSEVALIKSMYAKDATDDELKLFLFKAQLYGLHPMRGEIFFYKFKGQPAFIVGRDGFLAIAHKDERFNGLKSGTIEQDGKLVGAWAEVYRKDWTQPVRVEVKLSEYSTGYGLWPTKPATMLCKVAQSQALRMAFNISGIYGQEEFDTMKQAPAVALPKRKEPVVDVQPAVEVSPADYEGEEVDPKDVVIDQSFVELNLGLAQSLTAVKVKGKIHSYKFTDGDGRVFVTDSKEIAQLLKEGRDTAQWAKLVYTVNLDDTKEIVEVVPVVKETANA